MSSPRSGLLAGGNWIIDFVKMIDVYPGEDALANIGESAPGTNGGAPYNVLMDLARLGVSFPLEAVGLIGNDANGDLILDDCRSRGIDIDQLQRTSEAPTSFTDVMTVCHTGRRTFFHCRGTNALLRPVHFDFSKTQAKIFHLGYLLLLDELDRPDAVSGTQAGAVLARARAAGLLTSVDVVSEEGQRFASVVLPTLPQVDILFVNEFEAQRITGKTLKTPAGFDWSAMQEAAQDLLDAGVRQWVFLHCEEGAIALGKNGQIAIQGSLQLPPGYIRGTTGAGDAFAAGVLAGLHENKPVAECLRWGVTAAAASLRHASASQGIVSLEECLALPALHGYRHIAG